MLVVNVNRVKKHCSICWEETKTKHFQKLRSEKELDLIKAFSILIDEPYTDIAQSKSEDLEAALYQCVSYVFTQPEYFRDLEFPKSIRIRDQHYILPTDVQALSIEQNMHIRKAMAKANTYDELISIAVAIYLQPIVDQTEFAMKAAKELEKEILEMPIGVTYPIGFFFLHKLNKRGFFGIVSLCLKKMKKLNLKIKSLSWPMQSSLNLTVTSVCLMSSVIGTANFQVKSNELHSVTSCHLLSSGISEKSCRKDIHVLKNQ
jgi:hypothetical protein